MLPGSFSGKSSGHNNNPGKVFLFALSFSTAASAASCCCLINDGSSASPATAMASSSFAGAAGASSSSSALPTSPVHREPPPLPPSLDEAGSVMAEINALFAPPGRDKRNSNSAVSNGLNPRPVELHPYFRRPGKGHNHDCCDACGEGGDLICCDHCPASFHFSCHAPPLEEDDIPMGDWMCLRCYVRDHGRLEAIRASSRDSAVEAASAASQQLQPQQQQQQQQAASSDGGEGSNGEASSEEGTGGGNGGRAKTRSSRLSRAAKKPAEAAKAASSSSAGPSSTKPSSSSSSDKSTATVVKIYKQKYARYLSLRPATGSPFDRLVAAAQVVNAEQFVLPVELESRESLPFSWKWADERQDDFDAYPKLCFECSKTSRGIPSVGCDFCPNVYHLDCLNPPLCEIPRERWMCPAHPEHLIDSKLVGSTSLTARLRLWDKYARAPVDTESVRLEFFRKARAGRLYQRSGLRTPNTGDRVKVPNFVKAQYRNPVPKVAADPSSLSMTSMMARPTEEDDDGRRRKADATEEEENEFLVQVISLQESLVGERGEKVRKRLAEERRDRRRDRKKRRKKDEEGKKDEDAGDSALSDDGTISDCSVDFDSGEDDDGDLSPEVREALNSYVSRRFSGDSASTLGLLSPAVRDLLAAQRLRDIYFPDRAASSSAVCPGEEVQARAALIPLLHSRDAAPALMRYRTLDVGLGAHNQLDLSSRAFLGKSARCNFVSSRHASIYFDQHARVYELINYSEHGTLVDGVAYALSRRPVASLRAKGLAGCHVMSARGGGPSAERTCYCGEDSIAKLLGEGEACENSAVLHHGSLVRIGCLQFVFSIMDYHHQSKKREAEEEDKKEEEAADKVHEEVEAAEAKEEEGETKEQQQLQENGVVEEGEETGAATEEVAKDEEKSD